MVWWSGEESPAEIFLEFLESKLMPLTKKAACYRVEVIWILVCSKRDQTMTLHKSLWPLRYWEEEELGQENQ